VIEDSSTCGARVLLDAVQRKEFSPRSPSISANALREGEIAEVLVIEVHFMAMGDNVPANESHRKLVLRVADLELEAVLEPVPRLGDQRPMSLQLRGCGASAGRLIAEARCGRGWGGTRLLAAR
jgi:hypothetical protein